MQIEQDYELEKHLLKIISLRNYLYDLPYDEPSYDELEEELHRLEDSLTKNFGHTLEKIISYIHSTHFPSTSPYLPISYLARHYKIIGKNSLGFIYEVIGNQGVEVKNELYSLSETRLVLIPNPLRLVLKIDAARTEEVWSVKDGY